MLRGCLLLFYADATMMWCVDDFFRGTIITTRVNKQLRDPHNISFVVVTSSHYSGDARRREDVDVCL
jgi:hypothetical protein